VNVVPVNIPTVQRCSCSEIIVFHSTSSTGEEGLWQEMCFYFGCVHNSRSQACFKKSEHFNIRWVTAIASINRTAQETIMLSSFFFNELMMTYTQVETSCQTKNGQKWFCCVTENIDIFFLVLHQRECSINEIVYCWTKLKYVWAI